MSKKHFMGPKENRDVIGGFLQERRETERKEKLLLEEIDCLRRKREEIVKGHFPQNAEKVHTLDLQIESLSKELANQNNKRKDICRAARTFSAGD